MLTSSGQIIMAQSPAATPIFVCPSMKFASLAAIETSAVHNGRRSGRVMLYRIAGGDVSGRAIFDATVPVLPEFREDAGFVF